MALTLVVAFAAGLSWRKLLLFFVYSIALTLAKAVSWASFRTYRAAEICILASFSLSKS